MEIYSKLHESLQVHVGKMHMKYNVFPEMLEYQKSLNPLCLNCAHHGFPCLNCAYFPYKGKLGPGYADGKRVISSRDDEDHDVWCEMLVYILVNDPKNLKIE